MGVRKRRRELTLTLSRLGERAKICLQLFDSMGKLLEGRRVQREERSSSKGLLMQSRVRVQSIRPRLSFCCCTTLFSSLFLSSPPLSSHLNPSF